MIIEQATVSDAEEILALQKLAYQSEAEIYNDFGIFKTAKITDRTNVVFLEKRGVR